MLDNFFLSPIFSVSKEEFNTVAALGRFLLLHLVHGFLKICLFSSQCYSTRLEMFKEAQVIPVPSRLIQGFSAPDPQK